MLGDTPDDAVEKAHVIRRQQVSPQTAILLLEQVWNRDLSAYDAEGPLPEIDPDVSATSIIQGRARMHDDKLATAENWRERAAARNLLDPRADHRGHRPAVVHRHAGAWWPTRSTRSCRRTAPTA